MNYRSCLFLITLFALFLFTSGCTTTKITGNWKVQDSIAKPQKILIIGLSKNDAYSRIYENSFVESLEKMGVTAVPGYSVLDYTKTLEKDVIHEYVNREKIDSILVTRLLDEKTHSQRIAMITDHLIPAGYTQGGWYGDYFTGHMNVVNYNQKVKIYYLETNLYEVEGEEIVWLAITRTEVIDRDPDHLKEVVDVLAEQLKKDNVM